jgi:hypothetical protein
LAISIIDAVKLQGGRFLRREDNLGEWVTICSRKDEFSKTAQALREQDERSKKSSEAVKRLVEKKQKQRAQQEHKSSDAKSRDETAGQSLPTASNQESSEDIDQRKPPVISVEELQHIATYVSRGTLNTTLLF